MATKEIKFRSSMVADKRNDQFAYLIKNVLTTPEYGLYPAKNYEVDNPTSDLLSSYDLVDIIGNEENYGTGEKDPKVIVDAGGGVYKFYEVTQSGTKNVDHNGDISATAHGDDGVYFVDDTNNKVYSPSYTSTAIVDKGTFPISSLGVDIGGFDGLHYIYAGTKIWKHLPGSNPVLAFNSTGFENLYFMDFYEDYAIFFVQNKRNVEVYWWDKKSTDFFYRRKVIKNASLLAGGVVDGRLMLVFATANRNNDKELRGEIVVTAWNGADFERINSIKAGTTDVEKTSSYINNTTCRCGNNVMFFAVDEAIANSHTELFRNYIYKVYKDGSIAVVSDVIANGTQDRAMVVNISMSYNMFGLDSSGANGPKIYTNAGNTSVSYTNYAQYNQTRYITNFMCNPAEYHRLDRFYVSFEKLFKNVTPPGPEELDVYYRTSDRQDWTLLLNLTPQKVIDNVDQNRDETVKNTESPVFHQRYAITTINGLQSEDGMNALPEFYEIQLDFRLKNGMSIIGAYMDYSNITRNTV